MLATSMSGSQVNKLASFAELTNFKLHVQDSDISYSEKEIEEF